MNRKSTPALAAVLTTLLMTPAVAQTTEDKPYTGFQTREIKALSKDQIKAYHSGSGMGLALAAELNRHPGPKHVLELRDQLGLTEKQIELSEEVFAEMSSSAVDIGHRTVDLEAQLDAAFASRSLTEEQLQTRLTAIAELQGQLRFAHLRAHLRMVEILTPHQIEMYQVLRGYDGGDEGGHHAQHGHGGPD